MFVADLCDGSYTDSTTGVTYSYTASQELITTPAFLNEFEKFEENGALWEDTKGTGSTFSTTNDWSGTWNSGATDIMAFIVKGGSCKDDGIGNGYVALFLWDGDPSMNEFTFDLDNYTIWFNSFVNQKGERIDPAAISHVSLYNQVPIPGAVWLLGSGLGALMVGRRRRKQV